jgi:hypothetical protein
MSLPKSNVLVTIKRQQEKFIGKHGHAFECKQFAIALLKLLEFELNCKKRSIKNISSPLILSVFATKIYIY